MTWSLKQRWESFVARGGPELAAVQDEIAAIVARNGHISAERVQALVEAALARFESAPDSDNPG